MFDRADSFLARLKTPLRLAAAVLLLWAACEALLYRSGAYYTHVAEPESNTGAVVNALLLLERQHRPAARNVLVFGDSRVGEGFSAPLANRGHDDLNFINLAVPGSTPRTWYYLLREIERRGYAFDAIVVGTLYEPTERTLRADWPLDPAHHAPLLGLADALSYPASFASADMRERARHTILFPALALRQDTIAALSAPLQRWHKLRKFRPGFLAAVVDYPGRAETMPALVLSPDNAIVDWREATPAQRALIEGHLAELRAPRDAAVDRANETYLSAWFGALADLAAQRRARLILLPLPRGPYRDLQPPRARLHPTLAALEGHANAVALPVDLVDELEAPAYFFDVLHLNRVGRERLSATLAEHARKLLVDDGTPASIAAAGSSR